MLDEFIQNNKMENVEIDNDTESVLPILRKVKKTKAKKN
jgi:hypothetical protein